ncbi:enoyl-CoA hydratase/isomerase family protein [Natrarchaeobius chitinivorans]|uniref:Enoyl-CoA hydratase/isomerase family protein n=1 Tax=Natrarchaeobius chitinivorans TaxID=1679083 RepID=A0A3N6M4L3_NATCH|nr:enoyl-CoA hydratase/isomerase family protein [Natrarchaeobius chitinivorans]RQG95434.1 enoyl-CoA hydratase/isomerase family protein [Natrarchaeobius chitinivorans]
MRDYETLDVSLDGDVLRIAIDRPEAANAINATAHEEFTHVFKDAYRSDAKVIVLTGNGDAFCAGADFNYLEEQHARGMPEAFEMYRQDVDLIRDMLNCHKPIIGRLNGHAAGLGATIMLFSDIIVASEQAKIGDTHVKAGLVAGDGCTVIMPHLIGMNKAKELLMTGELVPADEAAELGLVNYAVPHEELDKKVDEMVDKLLSGPQTAIGYTKLALNQWLQQGVDDYLLESLAFEALSQRHDDHTEAVEAFLAGREPDFPSASERD